MTARERSRSVPAEAGACAPRRRLGRPVLDTSGSLAQQRCTGQPSLDQHSKTCGATAHGQVLLLLACPQTGCDAVLVLLVPLVLQLARSLTRPFSTVASKHGCHLCRRRSLRRQAPGRRCPGRCHPRRRSIPWRGTAPPPEAGLAPGPLLQLHRASQQPRSAGALALHPAMPRCCLQPALSVQGLGLRKLPRATLRASCRA